MKEIKTIKGLIKVLESISELDIPMLKGVKSEAQLSAIQYARAYVQEALYDIKLEEAK